MVVEKDSVLCNTELNPLLKLMSNFLESVQFTRNILIKYDKDNFLKLTKNTGYKDSVK